MRRISLFVALALTFVFALAIVNVNRAAERSNSWGRATHDHGQNQYAHHQSNLQRPQQQPFVDGATNSNAIPDSAAREIVLRLLTSSELTESAKRAYLKEVGFDEAASAALTLAAYDFKRQTEGIEKEASEIKDKTWPNPDKATSDYLAGLQHQKEEILTNNAAALEERLRNFNALANWETHVTNRVKRKTKGFQVGMPVKKVGFYPKILDPFAAFAQAPGCDALVWVYSDTYVSWDDFVMYGVTSYSTPANNCGHTFNGSAITWAVTAGLGGYGNSIPLDQGSYLVDGLFHTNSDLEGYCPVANQNFYAGNNASETTLAAFLSVGPLSSCSPSGDIKVNTTMGCFAQARGSSSAGGKSFQVDVGADTVSGLFDIESGGSGAGSHTVPTTTDKTTNVSVTFKPTNIYLAPARFKGVIDVSSNQLTVRNGSRETSIKNIVP